MDSVQPFSLDNLIHSDSHDFVNIINQSVTPCIGNFTNSDEDETPYAESSFDFCYMEIFYLTVAPPFPGSHLNMFLVKKENPPFFIPDPALPGRTYRPRASPVRVLLRRRVSDRYVLPQLASCGEMAIA